jgi:3-methyladenine DNA glycosylase AlkD
MNVDTILKEFEQLENPENVEGMRRFGIRAQKVYGLSAPELRRIARKVGKDHQLAQQLWNSGIYEARIVATLVDDPPRVTERQMERWAKEFDNWAVCDACCSNLFDKTDMAYQKAMEWTSRSEEFVKRAGFTLMAVLAVHDKKAPDSTFLTFLPLIQRESVDERNFVRKAVNWALRQIGKRNPDLNRAAIRTAETIRKINSKAARWVAADALRELTSPVVQDRLKRHQAKCR